MSLTRQQIKTIKSFVENMLRNEARVATYETLGRVTPSPQAATMWAECREDAEEEASKYGEVFLTYLESLEEK